LGGFGGIQHCLIPAPQHVLVNLDDDGNITTELFSAEQDSDSMLKILGFMTNSNVETPKTTTFKKLKKATEEIAEEVEI